jgi:quinol-cytochrome oxidoreductase complex cytochrome b subunit
MHLIVLHDTAGSGNPLGVSGNYERVPMAPYFLFKDLITIFAFIFVLSLFVFFMPNVLGDSENYVIKEYFSYCQNELLATNHQIVGKALKLFQPSKNGNISYGTGNDSWYGKIETDYHNI